MLTPELSENQPRSKRVPLNFDPLMLGRLNNFSPSCGSTLTSILRSSIQLRLMIDEEMEKLTAGSVEVRVGSNIIPLESLLNEYGKPDPKTGRVNLRLPMGVYQRLFQAAQKSHTSVSEYIRTAAALMLRVGSLAQAAGISPNRPYPVSIGDKNFEVTV